MLFHRHQWVTTGAHYNPPTPFSIDRVASDLVLMLLQGHTNVTQTCAGCGLVRTTQHPGKVAVEVADARERQEA